MTKREAGALEPYPVLQNIIKNIEGGNVEVQRNSVALLSQLDLPLSAILGSYPFLKFLLQNIKNDLKKDGLDGSLGLGNESARIILEWMEDDDENVRLLYAYLIMPELLNSLAVVYNPCYIAGCLVKMVTLIVSVIPASHAQPKKKLDDFRWDIIKLSYYHMYECFELVSCLLEEDPDYFDRHENLGSYSKTMQWSLHMLCGGAFDAIVAAQHISSIHQNADPRDVNIALEAVANHYDPSICNANDALRLASEIIQRIRPETAERSIGCLINICIPCEELDNQDLLKEIFPQIITNHYDPITHVSILSLLKLICMQTGATLPSPRAIINQNLDDFEFLMGVLDLVPHYNDDFSWILLVIKHGRKFHLGKNQEFEDKLHECVEFLISNGLISSDLESSLKQLGLCINK